MQAAARLCQMVLCNAEMPSEIQHAASVIGIPATSSLTLCIAGQI